MRVRGVVALLVAGSVAWPLCAFAYRPFDSTDAAVADKGEFEVELSPLSYRHDDDGIAWIAPQARLNYGFAESWEIVLEGQAEQRASRRPNLLAANARLPTEQHARKDQAWAGRGLAAVTTSYGGPI